MWNSYYPLPFLCGSVGSLAEGRLLRQFITYIWIYAGSMTFIQGERKCSSRYGAIAQGRRTHEHVHMGTAKILV